MATLLRKARHRLRLRVGNVKHRQQLRDLQHFLELAAQVTQPQRGSFFLRRVVRSHQRAQSRAINECDVVHIQDDLFLSVGQQGLDFFPQRSAFFAQYDSSVKRNHRHAVHFALTNFQCHDCFLLIGKRVRRQPIPEPKSIPFFFPVFVRTNPETLVSSSPRKTCSSRRRCRSACSAWTPAAASRLDKIAKHPPSAGSLRGRLPSVRNCCRIPQQRCSPQKHVPQ